MIKVDATISTPEPSDKIWRYMTLTELVSLLSKRALFFSRVDTLDDPYEGSLPRNVVSRLEEGFSSLTANGRDLIRTVRQHVGYVDSKFWTLVNCWHLSSHESTAMWAVHGSNGLAIQSTYQRFVDACAADPHEVIPGRVTYLDYETEGWTGNRSITSIFHKRKSFEHEKEFRAVVQTTRPGGVYNVVNGPRYNNSSGLPGDYVSVDLVRLVEGIYVAPISPSWIREAVQAVAATANLDSVVHQSNLDEEPLW